MPDQPSIRKAELVNSELYSQYRNCDRWAVIVGVSKYQYPNLTLRYADRDAEELYKLLLTPNGGGFQSDHICKLTNEQATTRNITSALRSFLKKPAREDLVLIYFACHGSPDPDRPGNVYLLTYDTDPNEIAGTALPMEDIDRALKTILHSEKVIILADTCHSAAIGGGIGGRRSTVDDSKLMNRFLQDISRSKGGVALLTSAEANEVSFEDAKWGGGHGVFTHYLLEGMRGAADRDGNGMVTIGELFEYVRDNVKKATDYRQHPSIGTNSYERTMPVSIADVTKLVRIASEMPESKLDGGIQAVDSERGVSYKRLEYFLSENKWFEADRETSSVMLRATGREMDGWLDDQSLSNFSLTDLRIINELWLKYSGGRFGFSLQQRIFEGLSKKSLDAFGDAVGWKTKAGLFKGIFASWKTYSKLTFDLSAPEGHLPAWGQWAGKEVTETITQSSGGGPESAPTITYLTETRRIPLRDSHKIVLSRIQQCKL